jgi:hypothetical protein
MVKNVFLFVCVLLAGANIRALSAEPPGAVPPPIPPGLVPVPPANASAPIVAPPPVKPLPTLSPPPLRPVVPPLARLDIAEVQRLTPRVEIWRAAGLLPQVPARGRRTLNHVFVAGSDPVTLRLVFDPRVAGELVSVVAGGGVILSPSQQVLTVSSRGDCSLAVQLPAGTSRGHLILTCRMIRTVVPLVRAPLTVVQAAEARTGGLP